MKRERILGIDPGSRLMGFGVIERVGSKALHLEHGVFSLAKEKDFSARLKKIFLGIQEVCEKHQPRILCIEKTFFAKNAQSALKLGQARGAALTSAAMFDLEVIEVSPNEVKQSVVGHGHADKGQVQKMVSLLLNLRPAPPYDASDALAVALSYVHRSGFDTAVLKNSAKTDLNP